MAVRVLDTTALGAFGTVTVSPDIYRMEKPTPVSKRSLCVGPHSLVLPTLCPSLKATIVHGASGTVSVGQASNKMVLPTAA